MLYFLRSEIYEAFYSLGVRKCKYYGSCPIDIIDSILFSMFIDEKSGSIYTINADFVNSCPPSAYLKVDKWEI